VTTVAAAAPFGTDRESEVHHMSRLIERLDAQIAQAEGVFERECLKSRRASALARHGQFAEARFALAGLRSQSQRLRNPILSAWVALVDGLIDHCESLAPTARDKFRRAYELAVPAGDAELHALCAAWLAMSDFNASDVDATVAHASEAMRIAPADSHAARARAALVFASAWRVAGNDQRAVPWYKTARQHAALEGDVSLVSVLMHNMAAFQAGRISLDDAFQRADLADAQRVLLEAESTGNYDAGVGNAQLMAEVPLLRAQLLTVLGQYDAAIALFDAQLPRARAEGQVHREARFLADAAFAEVKLGRLEEAGKRIRATQAVLPLMTEHDDLAATHGRLAAAMRALGRAEHAEAHQVEARAALLRHEAEQRRWAETLGAVDLNAA
jgi:tetratricopeptide (TPR) repeat protein